MPAVPSVVVPLRPAAPPEAEPTGIAQAITLSLAVGGTSTPDVPPTLSFWSAGCQIRFVV